MSITRNHNGSTTLTSLAELGEVLDVRSLPSGPAVSADDSPTQEPHDITANDRLAQAADAPAAKPATGSRRNDQGRVHVVESNKETVHLGVFDANLAPVLTVDSGDTISFPDTWSHFMNEMQPGVPVETLAKLRVANPGRGPHSIIGPIAVNNAEPGDVLEIRYKKLQPFTWGAVFNNPGALGTGLLPQDYAEGQIKYMDLDLHAMKTLMVLFFVGGLALASQLMRPALGPLEQAAIVLIVGLNPYFWDFKDAILSDFPFMFFAFAALLVARTSMR